MSSLAATGPKGDVSTHTQASDCHKSVTVIVPVRNEESSIAQTLDQLLEQKRDGVTVEILVVDGRSTDRTRDIVREYAARHRDVRLLDNPRVLSSAARNIGIQESQGDYVLIVDGHCDLPTRTYFLDLVEAFKASDCDCLGRPQPQDVDPATTLQRAIAAARSSPLGHHPDSFIYTNEEVDCPAASVAVAFKRSVFDNVGLFDETFDACEDYEFNTRVDSAGLRCRLIPKLTIRYQPRKTLKGLYRQLFRYGRGRIRLHRKQPGTLCLRTLVPAAFVLGAAIGPLLCVLWPVLWPIYLTAIFTYLGFTFAETVRLATALQEVGLVLWLPIVFTVIHTGSGCGLLWEMLVGAR